MTERVVIKLDISDVAQLLTLIAAAEERAFWDSDATIFRRLNQAIREGMEQREESA